MLEESGMCDSRRGGVLTQCHARPNYMSMQVKGQFTPEPAHLNETLLL